MAVAGGGTLQTVYSPTFCVVPEPQRQPQPILYTTTSLQPVQTLPQPQPQQILYTTMTIHPAQTPPQPVPLRQTVTLPQPTHFPFLPATTQPHHMHIDDWTNYI